MHERTKKKKVLRTLFWSSLCMSLMMVGGGYLAIGMMRDKFVNELKWIEKEEMLDLSAIAQSSPGAIAINIALLIGYRIAGAAGAFVTIAGTVTPPLVIIVAIGMYYEALISNAVIAAAFKGMGAGAAALMVDMVVSMGGDVIKSRKIVQILAMTVVFLLNYFFGVSIFLIVICCIVAGVIIAVVKRMKRGEAIAEEEKAQDFFDL